MARKTKKEIDEGLEDFEPDEYEVVSSVEISSKEAFPGFKALDEPFKEFVEIKLAVIALWCIGLKVTVKKGEKLRVKAMWGKWAKELLHELRRKKLIDVL